MGPTDPVMGILMDYLQDPNENKIGLSIGAYKDD